MKKKKDINQDVKRVILYPDYVRSKNDSDRHFISASQLARLYGVRPTDIVKVSRGIPLMPEDQKYHEGWIELSPRYNGDYYDIHDDRFKVFPYHPSPTKMSDIEKLSTTIS